jgi:hypothetical protein
MGGVEYVLKVRKNGVHFKSFAPTTEHCLKYSFAGRIPTINAFSEDCRGLKRCWPGPGLA